MTALALPSLTVDEVAELEAHEDTIERGLKTFYDVGNALLAIRDSRLYRADHGTFEDYCRERWALSRPRAYQLIEAAEVRENLSTMVDILPNSERQARPLAALPPEQQREAWAVVMETAPAGRVTAAHVAEVVADFKQRMGREPFYCPDCDEIFEREVWHCPVCDHHWLMDRQECWNCHSYDRTPPPAIPAPDKLAVHHSSATPEHYTPAHIIAAVVAFYDDIDLDPCAEEGTPKTVPARVHYTATDDGLTRDWFGRVYVNPPYGRAIDGWVEKLTAAYQSREIEAGIALVPARVDTAWYRRLRDFPRCEIRGRLTFVGNEESAPFPSVLVYLGDEVERFARAVAHLGDVYVRYETEV